MNYFILTLSLAHVFKFKVNIELIVGYVSLH